MIALSWSRISDYRQCGNKFKLKYIDKAPNFFEDGKKSPHLIRGGNVHKALEQYVIKKRVGENGIPPSSLEEVERTKPLIDSLMTLYDLHPEHQIAINENFEPVDWYSKEAWFRVIMDLFGFGDNLFIGDYKTGKMYDYEGSVNKPGQLHMSSLIGMALWPDFEEVDNRYIYVDHKKTTGLLLKRSEHFDALKEALIVEHAQVNAEEEWLPRRNEFCKWCPAETDQCKFSNKRSIPSSK